LVTHAAQHGAIGDAADVRPSPDLATRRAIARRHDPVVADSR